MGISNAVKPRRSHSSSETRGFFPKAAQKDVMTACQQVFVRGYFENLK